MIEQSMWNTLLELTDPRNELSEKQLAQFSFSADTIRGLGTILQIGDIEARTRVARILGSIAAPASLALLMNLLHDPAESVVQRSIEALIRLGAPDSPISVATTQALIDALNRAEATPSTILEQLDPLPLDLLSTEIRENIRHYLTNRPTDPQNSTRRAIYTVLSQIGNANVREALEVGLQESDLEIRKISAKALARMGSEAIPALLSALDEDLEFRQFVANAIVTELEARSGELDAQAQALLFTASRLGRTPVRWVADYLLSQIATANSLHSLDHALEDPDADVRLIAVRAVRLVTEANIEPILKAVRDSSAPVRLAAVQALMDVSDPRARTALVQAANDEDQEVRKLALQAVGTMTDIVEVEPLIKALSNRDTALRRTAADVLVTLPKEQVVSALIASIKADPYGDASRTLGRIGDVAAVEPLLARLEGATFVLRQACIEALGLLRDRRALSAFITAMDDDTSGVREAAITALDQLRAPESIPRIVEALNDASPAVREKATLALEHMGPLVIQALVPSLESHDWRVRLNTVQVLGRIGDVRAVEVLIRKLHDPAGNVCGAVIQELKRLVDARAIGWLLRALEDREPFVRENVADLLSQLGDSFTLPRLVLAESRMSPRERAAILDYMRRVRYSDRHVTFRFTAIGDVVSYCRQMLNETSPDVQQGARMVLSYIEQLRLAQPAISSAGQ